MFISDTYFSGNINSIVHDLNPTFICSLQGEKDKALKITTLQQKYNLLTFTTLKNKAETELTMSNSKLYLIDTYENVTYSVFQAIRI